MKIKTATLFAALIMGCISCNHKVHSIATQQTKEFPPEIRTAPLSGGYSASRPLTEADKVLFQAYVSSQIDGVSYTPETVATQVVAGKNYKFLCDARTVTLNPRSYKAEVVLFVPLPCNGGEPRITSIRTVE